MNMTCAGNLPVIAMDLASEGPNHAEIFAVPRRENTTRPRREIDQGTPLLVERARQWLAFIGLTKHPRSGRGSSAVQLLLYSYSS
jgi:hypothetical protein